MLWLFWFSFFRGHLLLLLCRCARSIHKTRMLRIGACLLSWWWRWLRRRLWRSIHWLWHVVGHHRWLVVRVHNRHLWGSPLCQLSQTFFKILFTYGLFNHLLQGLLLLLSQQLFLVLLLLRYQRAKKLRIDNLWRLLLLKLG